jgi:hypothetical protein
MKKLKAITSTFVLLTLTVHLGVARAACMNPKTWVSGYKVPLALEVHEAEAIVIGRVISEQPLQEDRVDPYGTTAYNVSIKVLARLKGNLPNVFVIRNENTSSRYPISVGEEHILFVSHFGQAWRVDACGNSALKVEAPQLVKQIQQQLQKR